MNFWCINLDFTGRARACSSCWWNCFEGHWCRIGRIKRKGNSFFALSLYYFALPETSR